MKTPSAYLWFILFSFLHTTIALSSITSNFGKTFDRTYNDLLSKLPEPPNFDFWKHAEELGDAVIKYANRTLVEEAVRNAVNMDTIEKLKDGVYGFLNVTKVFIVELEDVLDERGLEFAAFAAEFSTEVDKISESLKLELKEPPLENQTERYQRRKDEVAFVLDIIEDTLIRICEKRDIPEGETRERFSSVKKHITDVVLGIGNLADNHPIMVDMALFFVVALIALPLAEGLLFRSLVRAFGISPLGPVKGSLAAWAQSHFFGAVVRSGSWFSRLQAAGMNLKTVFGLGTRFLIGGLASIIGGIKAIAGF